MDPIALALAAVAYFLWRYYVSRRGARR